MELIPKSIQEKIPPLYSTEEQSNPIVFVKLFCAGFTWYITEMSIDSDICFGYVTSPFENEMGYFSLHEISLVRDNLGVFPERDLSFTPTHLSTIKKLQI